MARDPKFQLPPWIDNPPPGHVEQAERALDRLFATDLCNECGNDVPEDDAGPSCVAHVLHIECGPWFGCTYCYEIRAEIP